MFKKKSILITGGTGSFGKAFISDILKTNSNKFETESLSLNLYNSLKINDNLNLNSLLGSSVLDIDKFESNAITGHRNGKQIYSAISLQARSGFTDFNFMPTGKIEFGITELSEYNQFNMEVSYGKQNVKKVYSFLS